ncbi:hypothetical protein T8K17_24065 [Thalassobaculum sp. OXR-137]|uniref:hypothetical protein n=1 Tax=Thalassobaculum sp. OXR-137 TaxID=3100173 RepID=UPI002AC9CA18|nr:hypothetical protein [Thalassobaculum sp. OXR-137]WPZ34294.1 hypothetical protein T8K17_24065 [Thalassobaculum sp. OXR-137]
MSISLILSLTTLSLLLATAGCGIAIAVLERKSAVPPVVEQVFMGLAAAGSTALVSCVVLLHPVTGGTPVARFALPSVTSIAMASEVEAGDLPACVPLEEGAAYDPGQARFEGRGAEGDSGHEVSVFRSPGPR